MARDELKVLVSDEHGRPLSIRGLESWLKQVAPSRARGTVGVAIVTDTRMRALNRAYRHQDYATDVLSFPAFARAENARASAWQAPDARVGRYLGDIVIA